MTPRQWALDMADILSQTIDAEPDHLRRIDLAIRIIARTNRRFADVFDLSAEEAASAIWDGYEVSK